MKTDVQNFITSEPDNPRGKRLLNAMKGLVQDTGGMLGQTLPEVITAAGIAKAKKKIKITKVASGAGTTDDPTVTEEDELDLSKKGYMSAVVDQDLTSMAASVEDSGAVASPRKKPPVADLGVRKMATGAIKKN